MSALDAIFSKYKAASVILQNALQMVVSKCEPDAKIIDLCVMADNYIIQETSKVFEERNIENGIAFPTCLSVNNVVCYFCPLATDESFLKLNDMVKIDMSCHVDGFIAAVTHSYVITNGPVTGRAADVLAAANTAADVAMNLIGPGQKNKDVYEAVQKVAAAYDCRLVGDVLCHHLEQFGMLRNKFDLSASKAANKEEDYEFQPNEAYAIDITMSTGDGKPKLLDKNQTTIFKWHGDSSNLQTLSGISQKFPFTARALERGRLSMLKSKKRNLLQRYHMLHEEPGQLVAHLKFTVLLKPDGPERITYHTLQELQSSKDIEGDAEIQAWLAMGMKSEYNARKMKGAISQFSDLQNDLLFQIFSRLQPYSLIRCGCVCKNWYRAATDATYLQQRYQGQKQRPLILFMGSYFGELSTKISTLDLQTLDARDIGVKLQRGCREEGHQLVDCFKLHGSCRGVLLFSFHDTLYLCNPVTKHWSQFPYIYNNNAMLFLYHHKGSNTFRILKKIDFLQTSSYFVMELDPGTSGWNERHISDRSLNAVVDPVPMQLRNSLYWVHEENGTSVISDFDTMSETLSCLPAPPLAENQVMLWTVLLDINDQLAASVSWAEGSPVNVPTGPTHIELWNYTNGNWQNNLQVKIPDRGDIQLINHLGLDLRWSGFICNENGQFLVSVRNDITCYDNDGHALKNIGTPRDEDHLNLSGFFLKESLLLSPTLPRRFDGERRLPPFFWRR